MRLLLRGPYLPVHCCCDPNKRLGWVPAKEVPGPVTFALGHPRMNLFTSVVTLPEEVQTDVAWLVQPVTNTPGALNRFLAVKSNDVPIEKWRQVPGFIEDVYPSPR